MACSFPYKKTAALWYQLTHEKSKVYVEDTLLEGVLEIKG